MTADAVGPVPAATGATTSAWHERALQYVLGFFEMRTRQSMSRAVALLFGIGGVTVAVICALKGTEQAKTVASLVVGGAVGLLSRKGSTPTDPPTPKDEP